MTMPDFDPNTVSPTHIDVPCANFSLDFYYPAQWDQLLALYRAKCAEQPLVTNPQND